MGFEGKVIIVTGGSSGIGADAAIHLAGLGASVAIVGRNAGRLNEVAVKIRSSGSPEPLTVAADVTKDSKRIIAETIKKFGKLDVLVNNVGIVRYNRDETFGALETFDELFDTNVRSILELTKLAVPHLEKTKGNVINISSIAGTLATKRHTIYAMSKAAVDHFTRCAALELAPKGIRVNGIKPGLIRTPIFEAGGMSTQEVEETYESVRQTYPAGRPGEVEDITAAIEFLASDTASFITGHLILVDGGKHLVK